MTIQKATLFKEMKVWWIVCVDKSDMKTCPNKDCKQMRLYLLGLFTEHGQTCAIHRNDVFNTLQA